MAIASIVEGNEGRPHLRRDLNLAHATAINAGNGSILSGVRIFYSMAEDGPFFRRFASIHPAPSLPTWLSRARRSGRLC